MQDPAQYVNGIDLAFDCAVRPGRAARIDPDYVVRVNHEVYFFSDGVARHRFLRGPLRWCGDLTDPVTLERFRPDRRSPRLEWSERPYYFSSTETRDTFLADPDMYSDPREGMAKAP